MFRLLAAFAAVLWLSTPAAAQDWWYAESDHFRVYSAGGEERARDMATKLERVDQAMRLFTGIAPDDSELAEVQKVTIFQFGETDDIGNLAGQRGVAGFFIRRAGNSVAFVPLTESRRRRLRSTGVREKWDQYDYNIDPDIVLFHEYAHYFMFQHAPAAYPPWYVEGLAEVFGMLQLAEDGFALGAPPPHRTGEIAMNDVDLDEIFREDDRNARRIKYPYYGHGWLLTSYLSFAPERTGQLGDFIIAINRGTPTREAAEQAFGDLDKLEKELSSYRTERALMMSAKFAEQAKPEVDVRKLTSDEAARMMVMIRSNRGVDRSEARSVLKDAREVAERYPNSLAVKRALLEAEHDAGNNEEATRLANELVDTEYGVFANLTLARMAMEYAKTDPVWLTKAREHFVAANRLEPEEPNALVGYYLTYRLGDEEVPENALIALEEAYRIAPFDNQVRLLLAHLLLLEERDRGAMAILSPFINQPHGGKRAEEIRELVDKLKAGERQPLIDELAPSLTEDDA